MGDAADELRAASDYCEEGGFPAAAVVLRRAAARAEFWSRGDRYIDVNSGGLWWRPDDRTPWIGVDRESVGLPASADDVMIRTGAISAGSRSPRTGRRR